MKEGPGIEGGSTENTQQQLHGALGERTCQHNPAFTINVWWGWEAPSCPTTTASAPALPLQLSTVFRVFFHPASRLPFVCVRVSAFLCFKNT